MQFTLGLGADHAGLKMRLPQAPALARAVAAKARQGLDEGSILLLS